MDERVIARRRRWRRLAVSFASLVIIVAGLLLWLFQPRRAAPAIQFHEAASVAGFLLAVAAGAGIAAMATVQFWKIVFFPRSVFHTIRLRSIFGDSMVQVLGLSAPRFSEAAYDEPFRSRRPITSRDLKYLLDNPTEVVMGQLRSAADYVVLRPNGFEDALFRLAGPAGRRSVEEYLGKRRAEEENPDNHPSDANEALVAVRFFVEQHLNLIHISLRENWRRRVRLVAAVVAGLAGLLIVVLSDLGPMAKVSAIFATVVWGGFFSWLARDVVALVERRRN